MSSIFMENYIIIRVLCFLKMVEHHAMHSFTFMIQVRLWDFGKEIMMVLWTLKPSITSRR